MAVVANDAVAALPVMSLVMLAGNLSSLIVPVVIFANVSANSIVGALTGDVTGTATTATIANALQGTPNIEVGVITAVSAEFSGSVTIGGTLTYEDVKNVDSVGVVTANIGIDVVAGGIDVTAGGINVQAGILTAVTISAGDYTGTGNVNAAMYLLLVQ